MNTNANSANVSEALVHALAGSPRQIDLMRFHLEETVGVSVSDDARLDVAVHLHEILHEGSLRHGDLENSEQKVGSEEWRYLSNAMKLLDLITRHESGDGNAAKRAKDIFEEEENNLTSFSIQNGYANTLAKIMLWIKQTNPEFNEEDSSDFERPTLF